MLNTRTTYLVDLRVSLEALLMLITWTSSLVDTRVSLDALLISNTVTSHLVDSKVSWRPRKHVDDLPGGLQGVVGGLVDVEHEDVLTGGL